MLPLVMFSSSRDSSLDSDELIENSSLPFPVEFLQEERRLFFPCSVGAIFQSFNEKEGVKKMHRDDGGGGINYDDTTYL